MNKISFTFSILFAVLLTTLSGQSKTLNLERYDGLSVAGNIELILIPDAENYAEIEVENTNIEKLETKLKGSTLKFNLKNRGFLNLFGSGGKAYIKLHYTEDLESISSSASADIVSNSVITSSDLRMSSSSGSKIDLEIECNSIRVTVSSGADVILDGSFDEQEIKVSSGGSYSAQNVETRKVVAKASSGGNIKVWAKDNLKGRASSGGSIAYKGEPRISDISSSSGGRIKSKN